MKIVSSMPPSSLRGDAGDLMRMSTPPPEEPFTVSTVAGTVVGVGHHLLKVEGYSRLKRTHGGNGVISLRSGKFKAGGHTWRILCYLNGASEEDTGFVSLYVARADAGAAVVHAETEFELVPHRGALVGWWPPRHLGRGGADPFSQGAIAAWGFPKFIGVKALERSRFLRDDGFAVRCKVTVVKKRDAVAELLKAEDMERMGMVCVCKDDSCKRHHERPAETFGEAVARFCRFFRG